MFLIPKPKLGWFTITSKFLQMAGNSSFRMTGVSMQCYRRYMEDEFRILPSFRSGAFVGVFDGHSGDFASKYSANHLTSILKELPEISPKSVQEACMELDLQLLGQLQANGGTSGSTATFALIEPENFGFRILAANIGDSRALLIRGDSVDQLSADHDPDRATELARIEKAGGLVLAGRLDGRLTVSRALGDPEFKGDPGLPRLQQKVIALPEIKVVHARPSDLLLLASDGLFETLTSEDVRQFLATELPAVGPAAALTKLLDFAQSEDNITVTLTEFCDGSEHQGTRFLPGPVVGDDNAWFMEAYRKNCERYGYSFEEAVALRRTQTQRTS